MEYSVEILTPFYQRTGVILPLTNLEAARSLNKPGSFTFTLPKNNVFQKGFLKKDMVFKIYRIFPNGFRNLVGNTWWFLRTLSFNYDDQTWSLTGHDTIGILARYLVAYTKETDYAEKTIEFGLSDYADNLMKAFLRENIGGDAFDISRDLSTYIEIEGDTSLGAVSEKEAAFQTLDKVCTDLANQSETGGVPLYYDVVPKGEKLFFQTFPNQLGTDRTTIQRNIKFDLLSNTLRDATLTWDWSNEVTVGYIGGDGEGAAKLITTLTNDVAIEESPFSRVEKFFDEGDISDEGLLTIVGQADMLKSRAKLLLSGSVVDTPQQRFGRDYFFGDKVILSVDKFQSTSMINAFSLRYVNGKEELDIKLTGEVYI